MCPHRTVCGNLSRHTGRSLAPHAILLQARLSADTRLSHLRHFHHCWWHAARCKWQRMRTCAATAWHRSRPTNPRRHRCDCRAIRPTTGVAAPSGSIYRSAPAVKRRTREAGQPCRELERGLVMGACVQKAAKAYWDFCPGEFHKVVRRRKRLF